MQIGVYNEVMAIIADALAFYAKGYRSEHVHSLHLSRLYEEGDISRIEVSMSDSNSKDPKCTIRISMREIRLSDNMISISPAANPSVEVTLWQKLLVVEGICTTQTMGAMATHCNHAVQGLFISETAAIQSA